LFARLDEEEGNPLVKRVFMLAGAVVVGLAMVVPSASARPAGAPRSHSQSPYDFFRAHGYFEPNPAAYLRAKALLDAQPGQPVNTGPTSPHAPVPNPSFDGQFETDLAPPDTTGAIGPNNYVETINLRIGVYNRSGGLITSTTMEGLFGGSHFNYSDPQALWDPDTQRFYLLIWDTTNATYRWAFSKNDNPTTLTSSSWCTYTSGFGYPTSSFPDYPKLGTTKDFLIVGNDYFPNGFTFQGGEIVTIEKPQGSGPVTTCPANTYATKRFSGLKNQDGSILRSPEPAQQTDPSHTGWVVTTRDVSIGGSANYITLFKVVKKLGVAKVKGPFKVSIPSFSMPADALQCSTSNRLDTIDGRFEHAVSAIAPSTGKAEIWTAHAVSGGLGSEERWYEITPSKTPSLVQSGSATSGSLFVWNGGIAPDRTVNPGGAAHGDDMVMSFTTSSSTQCAAIQAVSKIGSNPQSSFVVVKQSTVPDNDFTCSPCRWGDYSGASPDPAAPLGDATGKVWLANQYVSGTGNPNWRTWIFGSNP